MKLRLPHKFQTALMAALASVSITTLSTGSSAQAWTAQTSTTNEYVSTTANYTEYGWNYNAETGVISAPNGIWDNFNFELSVTKLAEGAANTGIVYVTSTAGNKWGLAAGKNSDTKTGLGGVWGTNAAWGANNFFKTQEDVEALDTDHDGLITMSAKINNSGTNIYSQEDVQGAAFMASTGLKDSVNAITSLTIDKNYITKFRVDHTSATVTLEDGTVKKYDAVLAQESGRSATLRTDMGNDAYIVSSDAEVWFASGNGTVDIAGDLYVQGTYPSEAKFGALRLNTQTGGVLNLNGDLYLGADSEIGADSEGDSNSGTVNFNGAVSGAGHTLKLSVPRFSGSNMVFNDKVALGGFVSETSVAFGANAVASLGNVTFTTANRTFTNDGQVTVTSGTINGYAGAGTLTKEGAGALTMGGATNIRKTIQLEGGSLALAGDVTVNIADIGSFDVFDLDAQTYSYAAKNSGYLTSSGQYYLVKGAEGTTASHSGSITGGSYVDTPTKTKGNGDIIITFDTTGATHYYVNESMNTHDDVTDGAYNILGATDVTIKAGATLTAYTYSDSFTNPAKLHGAGTFALAGNRQALNTNLSLGDDWTGAVKISGSVSNLNLSSTCGLYNEHSSIILDGWTGSFANADQNITADVVIGEGGATISEGYSSRTTTFAGALIGSGDIVRNNQNSPTINLVFSGDVSRFTGAISHTRAFDNNTVNLTFKEKANLINASHLRVLDPGAGILNINFEAENTVVNSVLARNTTRFPQNRVNVNAKADVTFKNTVDIDILTISDGKSAAFNNTTAIRTLAGAGALKVNSGSNAVTVNGVNNYSGDVTVDSGTLALGAGNIALGTVTLAEGATLKSDNGGSAEMTGLSIDTLNVAGNAAITKNTWSTQLSVGALNGGGNLQVNLGTDHNAAPSMLKLTGAGNYSGELTFGPTSAGTWHNIPYGQFLEIASGNALAGAVLNLAGESGVVASAALNDTTVNLAGLKGNQYSYIYSGATPAATTSAAPAGDGTDRKLAITTALGSRYEYAGNISAHVNLEKLGEGTQVLNGDNVGMGGSVTVTAGTLVAGSANALAGSGLTTVNGGATLELSATATNAIGGGLSLEEGAALTFARANNFHVTGDLSLGANTILNLQALESMADIYTSTLTLGSATGNISKDNFGTVSLNWNVDPSRNATLDVQDGNLVITLTQLGREVIWDGGSHNWSDANWHTADGTPASFTSGDAVVFDGTNGAATVTLTENTNAGKMTLTNAGATLTVNTGGFNLTVDDLLSADDSADNKLTKSGTGTATFNGEGTVYFDTLTIGANAGTTIFNQHVVQTGNTPRFDPKSNVAFNKGYEYTGTQGYAMLVSNNAMVTLGGNSDLTDKNIGVDNGTGKLVVIDGGYLKAKQFMSTSSDVNKDGFLEIQSGGEVVLQQHLWAKQLDLSGTLSVDSEGNANVTYSKVATFNLSGGTATFKDKLEVSTAFNAQGGTVTLSNAGADSSITTLNVSNPEGVATKIDNARNLTIGALNIVDNYTNLEFTGHVVVNNGSNYVDVGYNSAQKNYEKVTFGGGFDYTGNATYALLIGLTNTVELGGNSAWGNAKTFGMETSGKLILRDNATVSVGRVYNSKTTSNNGVLVMGKDSRFSITNTTAASSTISTVENNGGTLEFANALTLATKLSGTGTLSYNGTAEKTLTVDANVTEYTGTLQNTSAANLNVSLGTGANQLHMDINSTGNGLVNLTMNGGADYYLYGTQKVNNISHSANVHMEVKEEGNVTATGKVLTGNLDVGTTDAETGAVFTLSGGNAMLVTSGDVHTYGANVRGYGTFGVADGATQTLPNISNFHGTFAADGADSVLTLSGTLANDVKLRATDGGVIRVTSNATINGDVSVSGTSTLDVVSNLNLGGATLTQTGGSISVAANKTLTLGNASITSAIANSGTVTFTKDITSSGLAKEGEDDTFRVGADDNKSTNGNYFFQGERTESTLRVVTGGTVNPGGHTVTQDNVAYALKTDGTATGVTADNVLYGIFVQSAADTTLNVSQIAATAAKHNQILYQVAVDSANLVVDQFVQYVQIADAHVTNTVNTDCIGALQITGGDNTLVGSVTSLPEMTQFVRGEEGSLKMQNATASPYQVNAGNNITFADTASVTIHAAVAEAGSEQFDVYSLNNARFTVEADTMQAMNTGNVTVDNHLKVASIATGGASLTLANGVEETLKNVTAISGDIKFMNMAEARGTTAGKQTQVGLDSLYIGSSKAVSFYENGIVDAAKEAKVTVNTTLTASVGAQLNADLEMASGSHLDVSGAQSTMGLLMGSEVTLNSGSYLDIKNYAQDQVSGYLYDYLTTGGHDLYYLFSGTENDPLSLKIDGKQVEQLTFTDWTKFDKDASEVYKNLQAQTFYMVYDPNHNNVGMVAIGLVPEPTTSTLSLLALCALAARRRRK